MKSKLFILTFGILFIAVSVFAQGYGEHGKRKGYKSDGQRIQKMLDLSDEQADKIQDLRLNHQKEMLPLRTEVQKLQAELKLVQTADKFDESKAKKLVGDISSLRQQMQMKKINHQQMVRNILTPEQRKKFDMHLLSNKRDGKRQMRHLNKEDRRDDLRPGRNKF